MNAQIQVVTGVTGGFIAAVPSKTVIIDYNGSTAKVTKYVKSSDPSAVDGYLQSTSNQINATEIQTLMIECQNVLRSLPKEEPTGCQDIYKMDVSVIYNSDDFNWQNTPNQGCNIQESLVKPTEEQAKLFKALVYKIHSTADKLATVIV